MVMLCLRAEDKLTALVYLVREVIPAGQPTLIFASTRHHVELLHMLLSRAGVEAAYVYGSMDQVRCCLPSQPWRALRLVVCL